MDLTEVDLSIVAIRLARGWPGARSDRRLCPRKSGGRVPIQSGP